MIAQPEGEAPARGKTEADEDRGRQQEAVGDGEGSRHHAALALAGVLLRAGWDEEDAEDFVCDVARAAGDEEWVVVRYVPATGAGAPREARFDWQVFRPPPAPGGGGGSVPGADRLAAGDVHLLRVGIDAKAEMQRRVRKLLFAPDAVSAQHKMAELGSRGHSHAQAFHARLKAAAMTAGAPP